MTTLVVLTLALVCETAAPAWAHGGFYQTPRTPSGIPLTPGGSPTGPTTGGRTPGGAITPPTFGPAVTGRKRRSNDPPSGPTTGGGSTRSLAPPIAEPPIIGAKWEVWWQTHKHLYLKLAFERRPGVVTAGGADAELPGGRSGANAAEAAKLVPLFTEALTGQPADVRASACLALARSRSRGAGDALARVLRDDESEDVKTMALLGLVMLGRESDLLRFHEILVDPEADPIDRSIAAFGLARTGSEDAPASLGAVLGTTVTERAKNPPLVIASAFHALGLAGGPEAVALLRSNMKASKHKSVLRSFAVQGLGRAGDRASIDALTKLLGRAQNDAMCRSAALALGLLATEEDSRAVGTLVISASKHSDPGSRRFSALALGSVRSDAVRQALENGFGRAKDLDKPFFAIALAKQGDLASAPLIREALVKDDWEESVQASYCIALGILGDRNAIPLLEEHVAREKRSWSPGYAALGLAMLGSRTSADAIHARLTKARDASLRSRLIVALGLLGDERAGADIRLRLGPSNSLYERVRAALTLGYLRDPDAIDDLRTIYEGAGNPALLRAGALSGLGWIVAGPRVPELAFLLEDANFSIQQHALMAVRSSLDER